MKITYGWKIGSQITIDPAKAGKEITAIGKIKNITPEAVVTFASKNKDSELHKHFEWDNEIAGDMYRVHQAGHLLRCITVEKISTPKNGEKQILIMRAFENVKNVDEQTEEKSIYVPVDIALSLPEYKKNVQDSIRNSIFALQKKAATYETYLKNPSKFNDALDTALKSV